MIPVFERAKTVDASDRATTVMGYGVNSHCKSKLKKILFLLEVTKVFANPNTWNVARKMFSFWKSSGTDHSAQAQSYSALIRAWFCDGFHDSCYSELAILNRAVR
jgi:hypothetical protein